MIRVPNAAAGALERIVGRRQLVRGAGFLKHAGRDGPNQIGVNGERLVQGAELAAAGDRAVVFDVGANVGQWSSSLIEQSSAAVELHAFELSAGCTEEFRHALGHSDRVAVAINREAVSSGDVDATLFKPHERAGSRSLHPAPLPTADCELSRESVRTCTLDTYCWVRGIDHIDLLKIDTEGHDNQVLFGSRGLLQHCAIEVVQFEYIHRWMAWRLSAGRVRAGGPNGLPSRQGDARWHRVVLALGSAARDARRGELCRRETGTRGALTAICWWAET
jgi:FkbM family methyltransferase